MRFGLIDLFFAIACFGIGLAVGLSLSSSLPGYLRLAQVCWAGYAVACLDVPVLQRIEALPDDSSSLPMLRKVSEWISHRRQLASDQLSMSHVRW